MSKYGFSMSELWPHLVDGIEVDSNSHAEPAVTSGRFSLRQPSHKGPLLRAGVPAQTVENTAACSISSTQRH